MKMTFRTLSIAILVMAGASLAGCSRFEEISQDDSRQADGNENLVMATTTVGFQTGDTRALSANGDKTSSVGETLAIVYTNNSNQTVKAESVPLVADDILTGSKRATFRVFLSDPKPGSAVTYIYPAVMAKADGTPNWEALASQNGILDYLAANLDYAKFEGTLSSSAQLPASATLENQLAICKFLVKDDTNLETVQYDQIILNDGTNTYDIDRGSAVAPDDYFYAAIRPVAANQTLHITMVKHANQSDIVNEKDVTGKTLESNNLYPITLTVPPADMLGIPLTLEATQAGTNVTFSINAVASNPVSYRSFTSGAWSPWATYTSGTAISLAEVGDKVQFKGTNARYASSNVAFSHFTCSKNCKLYGNIMSLINASSFAQLTSLTGEYAFCLLFNNRQGDVNVLSDPDKPLLLPATTLTRSCYHLMFEKCSSLTAAPVLPAPTLVNDCYDLMFWGCKNLNSVTCLATDISANLCTFDWLSDVASTGTFTKAPGMTAWTTGADGIPSGWTAIGTDGQGALSNYVTDNLNWD